MISVKIGWNEPSNEQLSNLRAAINDHIGKAWEISSLRIGGNYIYADVENRLPLSFGEKDEMYVQGLITGYLIAIGCEVL